MINLSIKHNELTAEEFILLWESVWGKGPSPEQTRLARLMDVMQVNTAYMDGAAFSFRDYCYGFTLSATFEKRSVLPQVSGGSRNGTVVQIHAYR